MLLVVGILQVILGMQVFDLLFSLTGGGPGYDTTVLVYTIYNTAFQDLSYGYAAAITVLLFILIVIASFLLAIAQRGTVPKPVVLSSESEELAAAGRGSLRITLPSSLPAHETWETAPARRRWRPPEFVGRYLFGAGVGFLLFFFLAPIIWIFIMSFQPKDALGTLPPHLTTNLWLDGYTTILRDDRWQASLIVSLETSILTTIMVLLIAAPCRLLALALPLPGKRFILGVLIFTLFVPVIVMAIPVLRLFQILHLTDTVQALVIVNVAFFLPLITWLLRNFFNEVPIAIENAARIDGDVAARDPLSDHHPGGPAGHRGGGHPHPHRDVERVPVRRRDRQPQRRHDQPPDHRPQLVRLLRGQKRLATPGLARGFGHGCGRPVPAARAPVPSADHHGAYRRAREGLRCCWRRCRTAGRGGHPPRRSKGNVGSKAHGRRASRRVGEPSSGPEGGTCRR